MRTKAYEDIFEVVKHIPEGRVTTYGAIAESIGMKGAARLVGYAMNHSRHLSATIPAHRVVNRNGLLTGRHQFSSDGEMQELLEKEGIKITDHRVQDFVRVFWHPHDIMGKL